MNNTMKCFSRICLLFLSSLLLLGLNTTGFAQHTPGYNNKIPDTILTPDTVETRIGTLTFFDGSPTRETVERVYDNLDFMRGVETFLNGMPAASIEGLRRGQAELGATDANHVVIFDDLMDSDPLFLTGNTDTVYALAFFDLNKDGPIVVEVPKGSGRNFRISFHFLNTQLYIGQFYCQHAALFFHCMGGIGAQIHEHLMDSG